MIFKTLEDMIPYIRDQIIDQRRENITFTGPLHSLDIQTVYRELINAKPELFLCIDTIRINRACLGQWNQFEITVEYNDVVPSFVAKVDSKKQVLDHLLEAVTYHRTKAFVVCKEADLSMVLETVNNTISMPEYLNRYLKGVGTIVRRRNETSICGVEVTLRYSCDYKTSKERERQINERIDHIVDVASRAGVEDWKKAFTVFDYCVKHWTYNKGADGLEYTAYGALVQDKAVCMGFSLALCAIFHRLGIPCRYICGKRNGVGHAWNLIYVNGGWFYIDVTDAISARNPFYHWGVTSFSDGRLTETQCNEKLVCNCSKEFVKRFM